MEIQLLISRISWEWMKVKPACHKQSTSKGNKTFTIVGFERFMTRKYSPDSPHISCSGIKALQAQKEAIKYLLFNKTIVLKAAYLTKWCNLLCSLPQKQFALYTKVWRLLCVLIICLFCANTSLIQNNANFTHRMKLYLLHSYSSHSDIHNGLL